MSLNKLKNTSWKKYYHDTTQDAGHLFSDILCIFNVQLMECFNVVTGEGNGYQDHVLPASLHQTYGSKDKRQ